MTDFAILGWGSLIWDLENLTPADTERMFASSAGFLRKTAP